MKIKIPKPLADLGLEVWNQNGKFYCIDSDGIELRSFLLLDDAISYLFETFESQMNYCVS
jgi:hypothetical protein